jgi:peptide/nickel transport system permease protein
VTATPLGAVERVEASAAEARDRQLGRRQSRLRSPSAIALYVVVFAGFLVGPLVSDHANATVYPVLSSPSFAHPLGTDAVGRDVALRVIAGAGVSLRVGALAVAIGLVLGGVVGLVASVSPRWLDSSIMRITDILLAFPVVVLALLISVLFKPTLTSVALLIGIVISPQVVRLIRGRMVTELHEGYVEAERVVGAPSRRILFKHIVPNVGPPVLGYCLLLFADSIVAEGALSFVGVGVQPPTPSWGNMILEGRDLLLDGVWWVGVFPGLALFVTVLCLNRVAETRRVT